MAVLKIVFIFRELPSCGKSFFDSATCPVTRFIKPGFGMAYPAYAREFDL
jgi:hypothetical protein